MPLTDVDLNSLVLAPSLSGVIYQARTLINELERINSEEFPHEACLIRDVFLCIAEHVLEELREIHKPDRPFEIAIDEASRIRSLAKYLGEIHSYNRYLFASSPRRSPPAVHNEVVQLTKRHFPKEHGDPVCIVRPQWTYNLKCVPLSQELKKLSALTLDPHNKLRLKPGESIISALWQKQLHKGRKLIEKAPNQIGVLSFASIDTPDALYIPLLGHELGHFLAFSRPTAYHEDPELLASAVISEDRVKEIMQDVTAKPPSGNEASRYHSILSNQVWICLRELLADRLAARMLGFSFFMAQAKFIKTSLSWYQPLILESGYPNVKLRLSQIFNQITDDQYPGNPRPFLKENSQTYPQITAALLNYFNVWRRHFDDLPVTVLTKSGLFTDELLVEPFYKLVEDALNPKTLEILSKIAERVVPNNHCPRLTSSFFERITRLEQDLPPSVPNEGGDSFSEIMSAGWAYQIVYGESRENEMSKVNKRFDEHSKTCRLTFKAIELIAAQEAISQNEPRKLPELGGVTHRKRKERLLRALRVIPGARKLISARGDTLVGKKGVLSSIEIRRRALLSIGDSSRINISPLRLESIKGASLDVHLGNWFAYARRTKLSSMKIGDEEQEALLKSIAQGEAFVPFEKTFLLHPGDLALGVTQEFIALPRDVMAFVEGRSSLGRMGLFVATATQVAPTFHGVIVLELANAGTVPLELRPGIEIAQLVFQVMTDPVTELYRGRYYCQIKPLT